MKKMMKISVLFAIMIITGSIAMAGNSNVANYPKHKKTHKHYKNHKTLNPSTQGASWR